MNRRAVIIAFSLLLGAAACGSESTGTIAARGDEASSTVVTEVQADTSDEVSTTYAPPDTEPDTLPTTLPEPQETADTDPADTDEAWKSHELAGSLVTPDRVGDEWQIDKITVITADPANDDEPLCGVAAPPTIDGLEAELVGFTAGGDEPDQFLFQAIGSGTPAEAQAWVDAYAALGNCEGYDGYSPENAKLAEVTVNGSDAAAGIELIDAGTGTSRFVVARFGGVAIVVAVNSESTDDLKSFDWLVEQVAWSGAQLDR